MTTPVPGTGTFDPNTTVNPNPNAPFDPSAAASTTDPNATTTDLYGLTPTEQKWTFYVGSSYTPQKDLSYSQKRGYDNSDNPNYHPNQYSSASDLMRQYAAMGTSSSRQDRIAFSNLQQELLAIGAYGTSGSGMLYRPGVWTDLDAKALLNAMRSYQQVAGPEGAGQPITFEEYINNAASQAAANGQAGGTIGSGSGGLPNTPVLTDPDTLSMYAQRAAEAALGRSLTKDELGSFINSFHSAQTSAYQNAVKGQGVTVDKNDPRASAIQYVTSQHSDEFAQHQIQGYADSFLNLFLPSGSQAPNVSVDPQAVGY